MVNQGRSGRFSGYRVNCEDVPSLPARIVADCLADPRRIPYLLIWARQSAPTKRTSNAGLPPVEPREAVRLTPIFSRGEATGVQIEQWDGARVALGVRQRSLPRYNGKDLLLVCNRCQKPRRALYGREAIKHAWYMKPADWFCRGCAGLSHASEGSALIYRSRWGMTRRLSGLHLWPRPEPWEPLVFTSPVHALEWGLVQNIYRKLL
jgi:hypothetical protein